MNITKAQHIYLLDSPATSIYVGDCREILPQLSEESVDLIFADPPFNQNIDYDCWNDDMPRQDYLQFTRNWIEGCLRVLAPQGSIWINIPDYTAAEIVVHLKNRGLHMINWCIWHFRFGQCCNSRFIRSKTHVLYFVKQPYRRIWNPDQIRVPSDRACIYNDSRTRGTKTPGLRVPLDVWYGPGFGRVQGNNKERRIEHQNQIPEKNIERIIRACSNKGDTILDPFLGSGTTCTVARALHRRSIGIDVSKHYAESAFERVKEGSVRLIT
jgi:DNA modification methylase